MKGFEKRSMKKSMTRIDFLTLSLFLFRFFSQKNMNALRVKDLRTNRLSKNDHVKELKYKILRDKTYESKYSHNSELPPHMKKRNRRFKSIYEAMHVGDQTKTRNYNNNKAARYGHLEYQHFISKNEIPDNDYLVKLLKKTFENEHKHHKKHHHNTRSHQRIKKLRSKPEAGIMQKKLKV